MKRFTLLLVAILPLLCTPTLTSAQTNKKESNPTNTIDSTTYNLNQIYANTEVIKKNTDPETAEKTLHVSEESLMVSEESLVVSRKSLLVSKNNYWIAIIALVVSVCTLWISTKTLKYQKLSVRLVSSKIMEASLQDLIRHLYRNLVCSVAMALRFKHSNNKVGFDFKRYPSETNMQKLKSDPELYIFNLDTSSVEGLRAGREMRILLRNYNVEVDVAIDHLSQKNIDHRIFDSDFDNLLFKPLFLISKINGLWQNLETNKGKLNKDFFKLAIQIIVEEHLNKIGSFARYQTEVVSHQNRDLLVAINDDNTFDLYTKKGGERTNSVKRGMMSLLRLGEERTICISYIMAKWSKNGNAYKLLTEIRNFETTDKMFEELGITKENKLRNVLAPYFEMLRSNKPVDMETLLTHMIKIDAILEMPKIGMISYA